MAGHDHHKTQQRGRTTGKFTAPPLDIAERRARACRLRADGWAYRDIATELGIDVHTAHNDVKEAMKAVVREPAEDVIAMELQRLDAELVRLNGLEESVRQVLKAKHYTVSHGKIVHLDSEPLLDDGPVLQAVDRLTRIEEQRRRNGESRRKLLGLDAPSRITVDAEQLGHEIGNLLDKLTGPGDDHDA